MDKQVVIETAREAVKHGGNMGAKLRHAIQYQRFMRENNIDFATMADSFAIAASWEGQRVYVNGTEWVPPLIGSDASEYNG